jgi:Ni/Co efflux regulator RcnB
LPRTYFSEAYVVEDYGAYELRRPPRGHCWVRVDDDFLLAEIATGLVIDILYDRR